jgi:hypothetical protein
MGLAVVCRRQRVSGGAHPTTSAIAVIAIGPRSASTCTTPPRLQRFSLIALAFIAHRIQSVAVLIGAGSWVLGLPCPRPRATLGAEKAHRVRDRRCERVSGYCNSLVWSAKRNQTQDSMLRAAAVIDTTFDDM